MPDRDPSPDGEGTPSSKKDKKDKGKKPKQITTLQVSSPLPYPLSQRLAPKAARTLLEPIVTFTKPFQKPRDLPAWDRAVDVVYHENQGNAPQPAEAVRFPTMLRAFLTQHSRVSGEQIPGSYMNLPDTVRFRICRFLIASHRKENPTPICLSHRGTTNQAWRGEDFSSLLSMLLALDPYLKVSFGFFADMMVTILMTERFHITYSPFVNTYFNPLSTHWYRKYGRYMRHISLEIDLTKLGFGPDGEALKLRAGTVNMDTLIKTFVKVQLERRGISKIRTLVLLCRRFYGSRMVPSEEGDGSDEYKVPYCPDHALGVCNPIAELSDLVESVRICGFSSTYTKNILEGLFRLDDIDLQEHQAHRVAPTGLWPRLPGQSSWVDNQRGGAILEQYEKDAKLDNPRTMSAASASGLTETQRMLDSHIKPAMGPVTTISSLSGGAATAPGGKEGQRVGFRERLRQSSGLHDLASLEARMRGLFKRVNKDRETYLKPKDANGLVPIGDKFPQLNTKIEELEEDSNSNDQKQQREDKFARLLREKKSSPILRQKMSFSRMREKKSMPALRTKRSFAFGSSSKAAQAEQHQQQQKQRELGYQQLESTQLLPRDASQMVPLLEEREEDEEVITEAGTEGYVTAREVAEDGGSDLYSRHRVSPMSSVQAARPYSSSSSRPSTSRLASQPSSSRVRPQPSGLGLRSQFSSTGLRMRPSRPNLRQMASRFKLKSMASSLTLRNAGRQASDDKDEEK